MWEFLAEHPVWGLVYLSMVCMTVISFSSMVVSSVNRGCAKSGARAQPHGNDETPKEANLH